MIFEVTPAGQYIWVYEYPTNNAMIARADRYAYDFFDSSQILGDVNVDQVVNVVDIILTFNIVLGVNTTTSAADVNNDGIVNILDVVLLVNIILGN